MVAAPSPKGPGQLRGRIGPFLRNTGQSVPGREYEAGSHLCGHCGAFGPAGCGPPALGHRMESRLRPGRSQRLGSVGAFSAPVGTGERLRLSHRQAVQKPMHRRTPKILAHFAAAVRPPVHPLPGSNTRELLSLTTWRNQVVAMLVVDRPPSRSLPPSMGRGRYSSRGQQSPAFTAGVGQEYPDLEVCQPARRAAVLALPPGGLVHHQHRVIVGAMLYDAFSQVIAHQILIPAVGGR